MDVSNPASATVKDTYDLQPLVAGLPGGGRPPTVGPLAPRPPRPSPGTATCTWPPTCSGSSRISAARTTGRRWWSASTPPSPGRLPCRRSRASADAGTCQNVEWLAALPLGSAGQPMLVSCAGARTYDSLFNVVTVEHTSLLLLNASDQQIAQLGPDQHRWREAAERGARRGPEHQRLRRRRDGEPSLRPRLRHQLLRGATGLRGRRGPAADCPDFINDLVVSPAP